MFYDDTLAGSWSALVDRVDGGAVLLRWAAAEPTPSATNAPRS